MYQAANVTRGHFIDYTLEKEATVKITSLNAHNIFTYIDTF